MPVDGSRHDPRGRGARGLHHTVFHALRSIRTHVLAWRATHHREALPDEVVIGTLRRPKLAITIRATIVRAETAPPPIAVFLTRMIAHPLSPHYPRCSLPLEPWQADPRAEERPIGYECSPCGTQIRWTPADVLQQMKREVRRHYAQYWERYREAIRQHARGAPRIPTP